MSENGYRLAGTMKIPDNKKDELNGYVLQLLDCCGIRKTRKISVGNREVITVERPKSDKNGIVRFDYSIFEKKIRQESTYDLNTCQLAAPDRGYNEYGLVMNLIMTMQEAYSEEFCVLMKADTICRTVSGYAAVVQGILGLVLDFPRRARMWDMMLFLRNHGYQVDIETLIDDCISDFYDFLPEHLFAVKVLDKEAVRKPEKPFQGGKEQIGGSNYSARQYHALQVMGHLLEEGQGNRLESFLQRLLDSDISERREMALTDDEYGMLAEISLYDLPPILVKAYASAVGKEFWAAWDILHVKGYGDILKMVKGFEREKNGRTIPFYRAILRRDEDEFLEFWDRRKLELSDQMKSRLKAWEERYKNITVPAGFDVESYLVEIIEDLCGDWGCRIPDRTFVEEFLVHRDENYSKALLLLRELMDEDTKYFPEVTRRQAMRWVLRRHEKKEDFLAMSAFCSLMTAHEHRKERFNF